MEKNKREIMKIIEWLRSGGGTFCGYDDDGHRVYSISNGEALIFALILLASTLVIIAGAFWIVRLFL